MKILFVLHYPPPIHGAAAVGLQIKESKVINSTFDCEYINLGTSKTIEEIGKRRLVKIFRYVGILAQLCRSIIFNRPDLCYFSMTAKCTPFYKDASLALLVKLFRIKLVYHLHNKGVATRQDKYWDDFLYRLTFRNTDVILLSKKLYPDIQKYVDEMHVYYCPNGIENVKVMQPLRRDQNTVELLFLSNLMESKGIFILLESCKLLKQKKLAFHCTFVGGTGDVCEYQFQSKLQELGLENYASYVGKKFGTEKEELFATADIFVHPTLNDCFPLVLLEAMQHSLPVISTFEGGISDIVTEDITGCLVPPKDVEKLANKLELLINHPQLRKEMGNAGRKKYEEEFSLNMFEYRLKTIMQNIDSNSIM